MYCSSCGAALPEGSAFCPGCGQAVANMGFSQPQVQPVNPQPQGQSVNQQPQGQPVNQQPQVQPVNQQPQVQPVYQQPQSQPMYQQPQGQPVYQQPQWQPMNQQPQGVKSSGFNTGRFMSDVKTNYMKLITMVGALLIFIAPFFHWMSIKVSFDSYFSYSETMKANMFAMAGNKNGIGEGVYAFYGILFLLIGIVLIAIELADYVPVLNDIKQKIPYVQIVELALIAVVLLLTILAMANGNLRDGLKYLKEAIHDADASGHANRGFGPIIAFLGIIASAFPRVCRFITGKKY